jgi:hypothetical protein
MVQNLNVNADINVPVPGLLFTVSLATLLHPVQAPAGYPAQLTFDLERIRQKIAFAL